jgi:hypothetical protein
LNECLVVKPLSLTCAYTFTAGIDQIAHRQLPQIKVEPQHQAADYFWPLNLTRFHT